MKVVGTALMALGLLVVAVGVGFFASLVVVITTNAILGPVGPQDGEGLREIIPAGIAYLAWAVTSGAVFIVGWRSLRQP